MSAKDLNPPLSSPLPSSITKPTTTIATASACPAANSTSVPAQKSSTSSLSHSAYVSSSKPSSKQLTLLTNNSFASTPLARPSHSSSSSISSNLSLRKSIRDPSFHQKPIVTHSLKQPPSASHIPPTQHTPDSVSLTKDKKISAPILSAISRPNTPSTDSDHSNRSSSMPLEFSPAPTLATITNRSRLQFNSMRQSSSIDRSSAYASDSQISSNNLDDQSTSENDDDDHHNDDSSESSGNEDLKFATSRNENVVLELSIDGLIRHISSNWKDIVGTSSDNLLNQPVSTIVVGDDNDKDVFLRATEVMKTDDSSYRVRFITRTPNRISRQSSATHLGDTDQSYFSPVPFPTDIGRSSGNSSFSDLRLSAAIPHARNSSVAASPTSTSHIEGFNTRESQLSRKWTNSETPDGLDSPSAEDGLLEMEGQGVLIYDNITGQTSHTMWILRPYIPPKQLSVDLPYELVHTLGFGVNILVSFLEDLSAAVIEERDSVPSPLTELCRICERHVPTWWFERHSELCLVEHKTQSELDSAHENLIDQRNTIIHLLALLDSRTTFGQLPELQSASPVLNPPPSLLSSSSISSIYSQTSSNSSVSSSPKLEYRGIPLPLASQSPASETSSPPRSPRMGSTVPSVSKRMLVKSFNLPKRSPIKLMELLIELCDLAVDINSPEIRSHHSPEGRIHSPQSESRIHRILNWVSPNVDDPALSLLCEDTVKYARQKVEAAVRLGDTITYFETIRHECESMVAAVIEDTIEKATLQRENNEFDNITQDDEGESRDYDNVGDDTDIDDNNSLFSESYLQSDALPLASRVPSSLRHEHSFGSDIGDPKGSRSVTPRSLLADSLSFPNSTRVRSDGSRFDSSPVTMDQSESLDFRLTDLDLNPRLQKKKSISNLSTYSSSSAGWTSLQRNRIHPPTEISQSPSTPLSSPLIFPHENAYPDSMNHRRQSSVNSDFSRAPVSPLLTSTVFPPKPAAASIKDYEIISPISKGAFGSVYLAKKRNTGEYFAIKVLKKADMIAKNQVKNVRAERAIMMSQSESPFVAKLYFTFQSKNYLYLVMEYLNGGDCAALVKVLGGLPEDWAKKYIAEVILGVEDLHKKGIIHRDLKPDNLLINQDGHLKLTDFGLSRMGLVGRHTHQPSIIEGSDGGSGSGSGSGSIIIQPKPQGKSNSSQETARPGSTSNVTTPGWANPLMESSISLVPGYFSYSKPSDRKPTLTRTESSNSTRGEALFNGPIFSGATKSATPDEEAVSSGSSDAGTGFFNAPIKSIPLFDPGDTSRKFVGTPDYLAPETIRGDGQDEMSDWWSTGCILFEFLYGYPPFHAKTPELVFENILKRNLQWPEADGAETPIISEDARDLIERLLCVDQEKRLGYEGGADEIKAHPFFQDINWDTLWSEEASFIPIVEDPESTDYFDSRGAESQALPEDIGPLEDTNEKSDESDDGSYSGRSSRADSLDSVGPVGSTGGRKAAKLPLHIPPHVRENRTRRPSETVADDFGSFSFKNLPMLDKANKDTLTRIKTENLEHRNSCDSGKRGRGLSISASSAFKRPESPSVGTARHPSPIRGSSQTSVRSSSSLSPIITNASTISATSSGPPSSSSSVSSPHRKVLPPVKPRANMALTNMSTSPLSIECPKPAKFISSGFSASSPNQASNSFTSSTDLYLPLPVSSSKNQGPWSPQGLGFRRLSNMESSPELGEQFRKQSNTFKYPKVFDPSPSNSDSEEAKNSPSLFNRRPTARKSSSFSFLSPAYRPLIVLVCENNPVWRYSIETLLKGLGCRFITVNDPEEAIRYGTGDVKFDIIFTELKFHKSNGADVAKIIHSTSSPNTETPVVCVTNYAPEAAKMTKSHFSAIIPKPLTSDKLCDILSQQCYWKPKEDKPYKRKDSQGSNRKKSTDEYDRQKSGTSSASSRKN